MVLKLLGNRVLLQPLSDRPVTASGFEIPNTYQRENAFFIVRGIGPGSWVRKKGKKPYFIQPEVLPGDRVVSRHWTNEAPPGWHKTEHLNREQQDSFVVVDARMLRLAVREGEKVDHAFQLNEPL